MKQIWQDMFIRRINKNLSPIAFFLVLILEICISAVDFDVFSYLTSHKKSVLGQNRNSVQLTRLSSRAKINVSVSYMTEFNYIGILLADRFDINSYNYMI